MGEKPWKGAEGRRGTGSGSGNGNLGLGFRGQRKSLQWLRGGDLARVGVVRSKGQKKIPRKQPLTPVTCSPGRLAGTLHLRIWDQRGWTPTPALSPRAQASEAQPTSWTLRVKVLCGDSQHSGDQQMAVCRGVAQADSQTAVPTESRVCTVLRVHSPRRTGRGRTDRAEEPGRKLATGCSFLSTRKKPELEIQTQTWRTEPFFPKERGFVREEGRDLI